MIRLERHSIVAFELTARRRRINRHRGQLLVGEPSIRSALDLLTQTLNQFRSGRVESIGLQRKHGR